MGMCEYISICADVGFRVIFVTILVFVAIWAVATVLHFVYLLAKKIYIDKVAVAFELMIRKIGILFSL